MTDRQYDALMVLRRAGDRVGCLCSANCGVDGQHPYLSRLARQKERELLDLTLAGAGATAVRPLPRRRRRSGPPARRVARRPGRIRLDNGWLRALGRLNLK